MHYEGAIYRPPSEAYSLIIQATVGCTHNGCTFCSSFKRKHFRVKRFDTVLSDLQEARRFYRKVPRIFIADGDALCMEVEDLTQLLEAIRTIFPECERVGAYSRASQILSKSSEDLERLRKLGLGIVYIGAESGSDEVLRRVNKGETSHDTTAAVQKARDAGISTSVTFILGLGGKDHMKEHAVKTGAMISAMGADYVAFLSLDLELDSGAPLYAQVLNGEFSLPEPYEILEELEIILNHSNCSSETILRSNHASNWLILKGTLPHEKERLLKEIRFARKNAII